MNVDSKAKRSVVDRRFYTLVAVAAALVVFVGFARTYYLKELFGTRSLPLLLHVHGLVMTLWFVLFLVQVRLVAAYRTDLHRRLGVFGALLALLGVVIGATTIIVRAKPHFRPGHSLAGLAFQLSILLVFAVLVAAAIVFRRRSDFHKRLMLLASVSILMPAIVRIPLRFIQGNALVGFGLIDLCVLVPVAFDTIKNRRLHPAFGWGRAADRRVAAFEFSFRRYACLDALCNLAVDVTRTY